MNEIKHHLTDALLMGYAAGTLPEAFDAVVAAHVSMCDECRARLMSFDAVGGAMLEDVGAGATDEARLDESLAATMAQLWPEARPAPEYFWQRAGEEARATTIDVGPTCPCAQTISSVPPSKSPPCRKRVS